MTAVSADGAPAAPPHKEAVAVLPVPAWADCNQEYLVTALTRVEALLRAYGGGPDSERIMVTELPHPPEGDFVRAPALAQLTELLGLSPFERDVLALCAGVELSGEIAALCRTFQGGRSAPSFGLALAALPGAHWSALTPAAPLRRWRLLEVAPVPGTLITELGLRVDERVLHFLAGVEEPDLRLMGALRPAVSTGAVPLAPSLAGAEAALLRAWSTTGPGTPSGFPLVRLVGTASDAEKRALVGGTLRRLREEPEAAAFVLSLGTVQAQLGPNRRQAELEECLRLLRRELLLRRATTVIIEPEQDGTAATRSGRDGESASADELSAESLLRPTLEMLTGGDPAFADAHLPGLRVVLTSRSVPVSPGPAIVIQADRPSRSEQRQLWDRAGYGKLSGGEETAELFDRLTGQFDYSADEIEAVLGTALSTGSPPAEALWAICRSRQRGKLEGLAERLPTNVAWDDLVLPAPQKAILGDLINQVRHRMLVHGQWGFAGRSAGRGLGISALFAGPSGTGKTLAAQVVASALELDVYRVDLASLVSKYIGETEKNLARVFDAAESGGAILLFDEADALFGKRSEVKDSHDRYANIEVSYLLQRLESYPGLAILTTNLRPAIDPAFLRRLRFVVAFPFPGEEERARIWERVFPPEAPVLGLEPEKLARLNVTGATIRNIALGAAFLAAADGRVVRMAHLLHAARTECAKLERPITEHEVSDWLP